MHFTTSLLSKVSADCPFQQADRLTVPWHVYLLSKTALETSVYLCISMFWVIDALEVLVKEVSKLLSELSCRGG